MQNGPECIPCCLRRVLHTAGLVTSDEWLHRKTLGEVMQSFLELDDDQATPAEVMHSAFLTTGRILGEADPYAEERRGWIAETTGNADIVRRRVEEAEDPFLGALRFSLASNLFDCELREEISPGFSLKTLLGEVDRIEVPAETLEELRTAVRSASRVLIVHDAAGELFFDRLLIERMEKPRDAVLSLIRESPTLGDATREDAVAVGLDQVARIIDPGVPCLGLPLASCSQSFREEYARVDLVVAKGQAAYQTLEGQSGQTEGVAKDLFFLLRVKCPLMAAHFGVEVGECIVEMD